MHGVGFPTGLGTSGGGCCQLTVGSHGCRGGRGGGRKRAVSSAADGEGGPRAKVGRARPPSHLPFPSPPGHAGAECGHGGRVRLVMEGGCVGGCGWPWWAGAWGGGGRRRARTRSCATSTGASRACCTRPAVRDSGRGGEGERESEREEIQRQRKRQRGEKRGEGEEREREPRPAAGRRSAPAPSPYQR
jgi:hypothetical protein